MPAIKPPVTTSSSMRATTSTYSCHNKSITSALVSPMEGNGNSLGLNFQFFKKDVYQEYHLPTVGGFWRETQR